MPGTIQFHENGILEMGRLVKEDFLQLMKKGYMPSRGMFLREMFVNEPQTTAKSSS
jgi:hypothetical protein